MALRQYGCYTGNLTGPIYGGWCGGSEGVAVTLVAYSLKGLLIHGANYNQHFPFTSTTAPIPPANCSGPSPWRDRPSRATSKLLYTSNGFANAGPMTEMLFRETACHALVSTVTGWHLWEMASTRNQYRNRATPLEARLGMEVGHAVAGMGMTREQANEIALRLLAMYEDEAATAPLGSEYQECYDVRKARAHRRPLRHVPQNQGTKSPQWE